MRHLAAAPSQAGLRPRGLSIPLLDVAADGKEHSMKEARELIAKRMNIADADLREMLPSGTQTKFGTALPGVRAILFRQI
jgi:restriction endonuclease Mrr